MKKLLFFALFTASLFSNCKKVNPLVIDDLVVVGADLPDGKPMRSEGTIQISAVASDGIGVDKGKIVLEAGEGTWVQEWDKGSDFLTFHFRSGCKIGKETLLFKAYEAGATVPKKTLEVSFNVLDVKDDDWIRPCYGQIEPRGPLAQAANGDLWAQNNNIPQFEAGEQICRSRDGGLTWQAVGLGVKFPFKEGVVGVSPAGKVAFMYLDNAYFSIDDGQTWAFKKIGYPGLFCHFLDENTIAVTTSGAGATVLSFDSGDTWVQASEDFSVIPFDRIERAPDGSIFGLYKGRMFKWQGGREFKSYISTTGINPLVAVWDFAISPNNRIFYSCDVVGSDKMDVYWANTTDPTNVSFANSIYRPDLGPLRQMFFHDGKLHGLTIENVKDVYHRFETDGSSVGIPTAPGFVFSLDGWAIHPNGRVISFPNDSWEQQTRRRF